MDWNDRPYEWVGDWSARRASLTPDREALVDATSGERYTYADLDQRANRTARLLAEYGVEAADLEAAGADATGSGGAADAGGASDTRAGGDVDDAAGERVAVVSRNRVEVFDLFFATGKTGGVLAPLSHRLARRELAELLELVEPQLLVVEAPFTGLVADALDDADVGPDASVDAGTDASVDAGTDASVDAGAEDGAEDGADTDLDVLQLPAADREGGPAGGGGHNGEDDPGGESAPLEAAPYHDALPEDTREHAAPVDTADVALDDVHLLLHTGGSTGTPKETAITHGTIAWNSLNTIASWGLRPDDVTPLVFPTFHTGGWNVIAVPLFHVGGTVVIDREVDPGRVLAQIERERATVLVAVPAVLRAMATHEAWPETELASLRFVKSGGGPCRERVVQAWRERGIDLSQGYGLTECGPNNFAMPDDWPAEKAGSVGKPALHVDARVVGEDGEALPEGEIGELELAGQHAAAGYWRDEAETEATFGSGDRGGRPDGDGSDANSGNGDGDAVDGDDSDAGDGSDVGDRTRDDRGWVSTGDLVRVDEDGYYHVVGRKKAMFVSGGENVYPPVVEDAVAEHPAVGEVVVIDVPDEQWGTVGRAVIEPAGDGDDTGDASADATAIDADESPLTLAELESFLEDRLASYEIPASVAFVDELPTSGPSKIDRQAVAAAFGGE